MPVKNKSKNYRTPQQKQMIRKAFALNFQNDRNRMSQPQQKKVAFGELTHDVMKIVDESAKVKETEVFDKAPEEKKKGKI